MKKLLTTLFATFFALTVNIASADIGGWAVGISVTDNSIDTTVTDDIDSNGTITTTKELADSVTGGSIFAEKTFVSGMLAVTLGVDYIPVDADLDKRTASQSTVKGKDDGAASTGTNSGKASIEDHFTFYIQPGILLGDSAMVYLSAGHIDADVTATWESVSSDNTIKTVQMEGTSLGAGIKFALGSSMIVKLDYTENDYDKVSYVTGNNTTVAGDIDNEQTSISVGFRF